MLFLKIPTALFKSPPPYIPLDMGNIRLAKGKWESCSGSPCTKVTSERGVKVEVEKKQPMVVHNGLPYILGSS